MKTLMIAISFLTRIPLKMNFIYDEKEWAQSGKVFPWVGLILGVIVALAAWCLSFLGKEWSAFAALLTGILLTGGLHLDGFLDSADGLFSARKKERILEIMKDSRVGAHGAVAAVLLLLFKFLTYQSLALVQGWLFIVLAYVFSRWLLLYAILIYPAARETGMGAIFKKHNQKKDLCQASTFLLLLSLFYWQTPLVYLAMIMTFLVMHLVYQKIIKIIGGLTGDIYGMGAELSEAVFLLLVIVSLYADAAFF